MPALAQQLSADSAQPDDSNDYNAQDLGETITVAQALPNVSAEQLPPSPDREQANVTAFLAAIAQAEGTEGRGDAYRVCYAYKHTIKSFADHPAVTGEWNGERLPDAMCKGAGLSPGCVSTAAGRYQMIKPTWVSVKRSMRLPDFSPESQDLACIELIRQAGALADVKAGRFEQAVYKVRKIWASLPGANYAGQGMRSISSLTAWYQQNGGTLA
jgi:lysozyme